MLQFRELGKHGRFGNQLFQIAFLHSLAKRKKTTYQIPTWPYAKYFVNNFPQTETLAPPDLKVTEPSYKLNKGYFDRFANTPREGVVDLFGYFQHEEYWSDIKDEIRILFDFKPEVVDEVRARYSQLYNKPTIALCVRRGDYLKELRGNYAVLSPAYYLNALQTFDYSKYNIVVITDDLPWCKFHFSCLPNVHFPRFDNDFQRFVAASLCNNFIIANSTYHWWAAYLGKDVGRVIQPTKLFDGKLLEREGDENFYG